ncbi:MAG: Xaa-Pro peptidase family protein [Ardenticatenaceae bacterium]|nr:Xaa-Pro peptidase family protein [Ardenticatenaceae bacterium]
MGIQLDIKAELRKARGLSPEVPTEEGEGRLVRCRHLIKEAAYDAALFFGRTSFPDPIRYLTNYVHPIGSTKSLLLLPMCGNPILLLDIPWDVANARKMSWISDIRAFQDMNNRDAVFLGKQLYTVLSEFDLVGKKIAVCQDTMPVPLVRALFDEKSGASCVDEPGLWLRLVQSPSVYDSQMIRQTAAIADAVMATVIEHCQPGRSENEAVLAGYQVAAELGAEFLHNCGTSTHINLGSGSTVLGNVRSFLHTARRFERGDMFWIDMLICYRGYYIDFDRTVVIGRPTSEQQELFDLCRRAYNAMVQELRAGTTGTKLSGAASEATCGSKFEIGNVWLGHSTGLVPAAAPFAARQEGGRVVDGQFYNLEPAVIVPGIGGASVEDCFYVKEDGCEAVTKTPLELFVC